MSEDKDWTPEIVSDLEGKETAYEAEIWAHDVNAAKFKKHALICQLVMIGFAAALTFIGVVEAQIDPDVLVWINGALKAGNLVATSFYAWYAPDDKRTGHIMASSMKSAVHERIKQQLLMPVDRREDAANFDRWISERMTTIGNATPYLPIELVAKYPKKKTE